MKYNYFSYANHKTSYQANMAEAAARGTTVCRVRHPSSSWEEKPPSGRHPFLMALGHQPFPLLQVSRVAQDEPPRISARDLVRLS